MGKKIQSALRRGDAKALKAALALGEDPLEKGPGGELPLLEALKAGHEECALALAPFGGWRELDSGGNHALVWAAYKGMERVLSALLEADPSLARLPGNLGCCALASAASSGQAGCLRLLLPRSDPLWLSGAGKAPMAYAVKGGSLECARLLAEAGGGRWVAEDGTDALMLAAKSGSEEMARLAIGLCNPLSCDKEGRTALMMAAGGGCGGIVRLAIPASDPLACDKQGRTALMMAAQSGNRECAGLLLAVSDFWARDCGGKTAADWAQGELKSYFGELADSMRERSELEIAAQMGSRARRRGP